MSVCVRFYLTTDTLNIGGMPFVPGRFTGITVWSVKKTSLRDLLSWNIWRKGNTLHCLKIKQCGISHCEFLHSWTIYLLLLLKVLRSTPFTHWTVSIHVQNRERKNIIRVKVKKFFFFRSLFCRYFFPTYENDSLLCSLEDDEDDEERVEGEASRRSDN